MLWLIAYWKEFYLTLGGLIVLLILIGYWMDWRNKDD